MKKFELYADGTMEVPCKGCTKRNAECHANCEDYAKYVEYRESVRKARHDKYISGGVAYSPRKPSCLEFAKPRNCKGAKR